ncbi:KIF1-binding protein homolog [Mizuhopecten yessoensis]|uniref:KIF-binding protein n=1 Tax=Mizuhopecten yessoensis TaxID=6573 RepID=A0A210PPY3_MIZYE|nr:KIF1-binding protein homolog [Mizuhopecten yessoensis]OWF38560.1 KIF1-binding protein-like [Mizuhopecten yessoensis]
MATEWQNYLDEEGFSQFEEARKLSDEYSLDDPEDDPYLSKYKAREILCSIKEKLKSQFEANPDCEHLRFASAALDVKLGSNYVDTEELPTGEEHLLRALDELEKYRLHKDASNIYHSILNNIGILWTGRRNQKKALEYFLRAESVYNDWKQEASGSPKSIEEYYRKFDEDSEKLEYQRNQAFEATYTHTLYYMAQVHAKLGDSKQSAQYCQTTLQRQLDSQTYDPYDWSINAATLSQYYITVGDFRQARHCLACSQLIFQEIEANGSIKKDMETYEEKYTQAKADIEICWAKYGIALLEESKDLLMKEVEDKGAEEKKSTNDEKMKYQNFNLEVTFHEDKITCDFVQVFSDAREVFLKVQKWLNDAKEFYVFDGRCTDHIEVIQDQSRAFKVLAFFEMDLERQCKMHKRRIDMLAAIVGELNPQHYLLIMRQLTFELAEIFSQMVDLKYSIMESESPTPSRHIIKKINTLIQQSIEHYQTYMDSLKDGKPELPEEFSDSNTRPALIAKFCMGRLHSKFLVSDVQQRLENIKKTSACYEFIINYCDKFPHGAEVVALELSVCREMVPLLPVKMEKIRQQAEM